MVAEASRPLERREVEQLVREVLRERLRSRNTPPPAIERSATSRTSGHPETPPGCPVLGQKGAVQLSKGICRAEPRVQMTTADMDYYGVKDADYLKLRIAGPCGVTFDRVKVRYHPKVVLEVHIDTDEGNACDLETATFMELMK